MPLTLKTRKQIQLLREAGRIVAQTFEVLHEHIHPGITTAELDKIAEAYIRKRGAEPVYKGYITKREKDDRKPRRPFPASICVSVNDVICHGIPNPYQRLKEGDIIGIDIGVRYNGWVGDSCFTFSVGKIKPQAQQLIDVTLECLQLGIDQCVVGNRIGDIGAAIQNHAKVQGYSVVEEYTGHGVGRNLHEEPSVPHVGKHGDGPLIVEGMVFTIEPMINVGSHKTRVDRDGWAVRTIDGSLSAQFEHQLAITSEGPIILTLP